MNPAHASASPQLGKAALERQKADQSDDAGLDRRAAQHGSGRDWRRRIGERHPAVERHEPDLHPEAEDEQRERRIAPGRDRQRGDDVANVEAAARLPRGEHDEGDQQDRFAKERERQIDAAGAARPGVVVMPRQDSMPGR